jgi:hypothetical protein
LQPSLLCENPVSDKFIQLYSIRLKTGLKTEKMDEVLQGFLRQSPFFSKNIAEIIQLWSHAGHTFEAGCWFIQQSRLVVVCVGTGVGVMSRETVNVKLQFS